MNVLAAGVAFYAFLTLLPLIATIALVYGLFKAQTEVVEDVRSLIGIIPDEAQALLVDRLASVITGRENQEFGVVAALTLTLYSGVLCARSLVAALNIIYHEARRERFSVRWGLALVIALCGGMLLLLSLLAIAILGYVEELLPNGTPLLWNAIRLSFWGIMALSVSAGLALLYRYGPAREDARWQWLIPGALAATTLWITVTFGFGIYIANFASYDAAYGSLAAVVILEVWLFLSAFAVLLGAKLNAELELQTAVDTTTGQPRPMGSREAAAADHVDTAEDSPIEKKRPQREN